MPTDRELRLQKELTQARKDRDDARARAEKAEAERDEARSSVKGAALDRDRAEKAEAEKNRLQARAKKSEAEKAQMKSRAEKAEAEQDRLRANLKKSFNDAPSPKASSGISQARFVAEQKRSKRFTEEVLRTKDRLTFAFAKIRELKSEVERKDATIRRLSDRLGGK